MHQNKSLFLLDIFCGTAGVAAAFQNCGGEALGLDHLCDRRRMKGPVAKVDLAIMLAPPCGTSSRAREIPVPAMLRLRRNRQPVPLRSDAEPMGLSTLRGVAKLKVEAANRLYRFTRQVIDLCIEINIPFICENPKRSLMWKTDPFLGLPASCRFQFIHACMYGSQRNKRTAFLMNFHAANLQLECDGKHQHLPWGLVDDKSRSELTFSTSLETEYPTALCKQLAAAVLDALQAQGKMLPSQDVHEDQLQRIGAGIQPRGTRAPLLLGDFKFKIDVESSGVEVPKMVPQDVHFPFQGLPVHSKLISSRTACIMGVKGEKNLVQHSTFGVFRTPQEFLHRAIGVDHPLDNPNLVDRSNLKAICFLRDNSPAEVAMVRTRQLKKYMELANSLVKQEAELKESLDVDVRKVLEGKPLLLFKHMAEDAKVGDQGLFNELTSGFKLTGEMPESHQFPSRLKLAQISMQQLKESSVWAKKMIRASCKKVGADPEVARAVHDETVQQLADGWVKGPYSTQQLDERYDGCWIPSKRFGVRQGNKIRAVDDFSEFLVNASVTTTEKLQLFGLDEVINTARTFLGSEFLQVEDNLESVSCRQEIKDFKGPWKSIKGRTLDLKSAYKQLARHPSDGWASILAVWNCETQDVEFYESIALPFGSVCAVMAFNRMARALRIILSELFLVVNTNFFDDFCQLETDALCDSAWQTAEFVMKMLGWKISMSEEKRMPFASQFSMLGAVVDLSMVTRGIISVLNKPSRIEDLQNLVSEVCRGETAAMSTLETLRGRMLYAAGHTFGRCTQLSIQLISRATRRGPRVLMTEELKVAIRRAMLQLVDAKPRRVEAWSGRPPVILFTDGACEERGQLVTHGAALFDQESGLALMFGDHVPSDWIGKWSRHGKRQMICQAEIFPVLIAKNTWKRQLMGRAVLWFIDNNSALSAIIRAFSPILDNYEMLVLNAELDVELQGLQWYSRVPSKSNLSDEPSRLYFTSMESMGFQRCQPNYNLTKAE